MSRYSRWRARVARLFLWRSSRLGTIDPRSASRDNLRLLAVVEGVHDIAFLRAVSVMLHAHEPGLPDLGAMEHRGEVVFVPFGGVDLKLWTHRLAPLGKPEFHLYDREESPETELRLRLADAVNQRPGCNAVVTSKRSLENYLHPAAILEAGGVTVHFGDDDDVADLIARQAHRLDSIIDDLLMLSRLEEQRENEQNDLAPAKVRPILDAAADLCQVLAAEKNIRIVIDCPDDIEACFNASLIEQAVVNLVDNAVKYSDAGQDVQLKAQRDEDELLIDVRDHGCGIAYEHLPRLFERFYRVDKARSRKLGGTGLGLAIVKHIAQFHKGRITVESHLNQGSVFTLHIPQQAATANGRENT